MRELVLQCVAWWALALLGLGVPTVGLCAIKRRYALSLKQAWYGAAVYVIATLASTALNEWLMKVEYQVAHPVWYALLAGLIQFALLFVVSFAWAKWLLRDSSPQGMTVFGLGMGSIAISLAAVMLGIANGVLCLQTLSGAASGRLSELLAASAAFSPGRILAQAVLLLACYGMYVAFCRLLAFLLGGRGSLAVNGLGLVLVAAFHVIGALSVWEDVYSIGLRLALAAAAFCLAFFEIFEKKNRGVSHGSVESKE